MALGTWYIYIYIYGCAVSPHLHQWLSQNPQQGVTSEESPTPHDAAFRHHWEEGGRLIMVSWQGGSWKSSYDQPNMFQEHLSSRASTQGIINNPQPNDRDEY